MPSPNSPPNSDELFAVIFREGGTRSAAIVWIAEQLYLRADEFSHLQPNTSSTLLHIANWGDYVLSGAIHQEVVFKASPNRIYEALVDAQQHSEFTGGPTEISREVGGSFSCFGGTILGRNIELLPNQRIVQAWRVSNWDDGVYSIVKFDLKEESSETRLVLDHSGFPEDQREHLEDGWKMRYWEPLRIYLA